MSKQLTNRNFLILVFPVLIVIAIITGILVTVGVEEFGKLLVDKNPIAVSIVASAMGAVLFLSHKLEVIS